MSGPPLSRKPGLMKIPTMLRVLFSWLADRFEKGDRREHREGSLQSPFSKMLRSRTVELLATLVAIKI